MTTSRPGIDWTVVRNGLDFLDSAVAEMTEPDEARAKFAALHLFASIEVLVKVRLSREHWALTVADVDKANPADFGSGAFRSVGAAQGLTRLRDIARVPVTDEQLKRVRAVEDLRNRVAHFGLVHESPQRIAAVLARGLDFLLWFMSAELRPDAPAGEADAIDAVSEVMRSRLGAIKALVHERMKSLQAALTSEKVVVCPTCAQPAMALGDGVPARCFFCLYTADGEDIAEAYAAQVLGEWKYRVIKQGGDWCVHHCVNCAEPALVEGVQVVDDAEIVFACFACGSVAYAAELDHCERCGTLTDTGSDGFIVCSNCVSNYMEAD